MDPDNSETLVLPDGRKLGYAQYGSPTGRAVFFTHGHPGSRFEGAHLHDLGLRLGARIICPDRPGFGLSSPVPERKLLDYPKDVERLADHLKIEKYGVLGVSGGGPYAMACAYALPADRLRCVTVVCGLGPVSEVSMMGARWQNKLAFSGGYKIAPAFLNRWFWRSQTMGRLDLSDDERLKRHMAEFASDPKTTFERLDKEVMTDPTNARRMLQSGRGAFAQGYDAALQDGRVLCADFGFRIQDVRPDLPVRLWYGRLDVNVPLHHGQTYVERLGPTRATLHVEEETHASIFFNWREQFLRDLVERI